MTIQDLERSYAEYIRNQDAAFFPTERDRALVTWLVLRLKTADEAERINLRQMAAARGKADVYDRVAGECRQ